MFRQGLLHFKVIQLILKELMLVLTINRLWYINDSWQDNFRCYVLLRCWRRRTDNVLLLVREQLRVYVKLLLVWRTRLSGKRRCFTRFADCLLSWQSTAIFACDPSERMFHPSFWPLSRGTIRSIGWYILVGCLEFLTAFLLRLLWRSSATWCLLSCCDCLWRKERRDDTCVGEIDFHEVKRSDKLIGFGYFFFELIFFSENSIPYFLEIVYFLLEPSRGSHV